AQRPPDGHVDPVRDEVGRAVGVQHVDAAGVVAARGHVAAVQPDAAYAVVALVVGRDRVRVVGGPHEGAVVLAPRVVKKGGRRVALGHRGVVAAGLGRVPGIVVHGGDAQLGVARVLAALDLGVHGRVAAAVLDVYHSHAARRRGVVEHAPGRG